MSGLLFFSTCCLYAFVFITCWTVLVYHKYTFIVFKEHLFWHIKVIYEAEAQFIRFRGTKDVFIEDQSIIYEQNKQIAYKVLIQGVKSDDKYFLNNDKMEGQCLLNYIENSICHMPHNASNAI